MLITELMRARALLSTQREAARILQTVMGSLDVIPAPDGTVRFAFQGDVELLDRLAVWGAAIEDIEDGFEDEDDGSEYEADDRDLDKLRSSDVGFFVDVDHERQRSASPLAA